MQIPTHAKFGWGFPYGVKDGDWGTVGSPVFLHPHITLVTLSNQTCLWMCHFWRISWPCIALLSVQIPPVLTINFSWKFSPRVGYHALNKADPCAMPLPFIPQSARCLYVLPNFFYCFWIQFNIIPTASSPLPSSTLISLYFIGSLSCTHFSLVPQMYL